MVGGLMDLLSGSRGTLRGRTKSLRKTPKLREQFLQVQVGL
jgi:hypothetical protein